ncbi:MAG TPA: antibiotic biosynthesis monooxygenase, partial [Terricaulis sp.]|nr:antibiotic biosynthesis monooxygenase [Terricaulis sp.]
MVARIEAAPGAASAVAQGLAALAAAVRAGEAGCTSYYVTHSIGAPQHFAAHARFSDWAAFKAHAETAHMEAALARITPRLAAPVSL